MKNIKMHSEGLVDLKLENTEIHIGIFHLSIVERQKQKIENFESSQEQLVFKGTLMSNFLSETMEDKLIGKAYLRMLK